MPLNSFFQKLTYHILLGYVHSQHCHLSWSYRLRERENFLDVSVSWNLPWRTPTKCDSVAFVWTKKHDVVAALEERIWCLKLSLTYLISLLQSRDLVLFYQQALVNETAILDNIICTSPMPTARKKKRKPTHLNLNEAFTYKEAWYLRMPITNISS